MKKEVAEFVYACVVCQKAKIEYTKPSYLEEHVFHLSYSGQVDYIYSFYPSQCELASLYISEIVRLHDLPSSILSDRDPKFTSRFGGSLHKALRTKLSLSLDLLRARVLEQWGSWNNLLPLVKFAYNKSYYSSIGMTPCENIRVAQSRQKNYHNKRHKDLEFKEEDHMFLKIRVGRALKSRKLSLRFINPY
ncbi:hypothetical protein CR513_48105, partial [Mucuna pruriens]